MNEANEAIETPETVESIRESSPVKGEKTTAGRLRKIEDRLKVAERELRKADLLLQGLIVGRGERGGPITEALKDFDTDLNAAIVATWHSQRAAATAVEVRIENE